MIITLNADFSANNIGRIDLPVEPTERQKSILAKYNREFSQAQISAFVRFMNTLENNGILAKMNSLYLPILADSASVAFINVVSDGLSIDYTLNASWSMDENGGVYCNGTGTWQALLASTSKQLKNLTIGDIHILWSSNLRNKGITSTVNNYVYRYYPVLFDENSNTVFPPLVGNTMGAWCSTVQKFNVNGSSVAMDSLFNISNSYDTYIEINKDIDDLTGLSVCNDTYMLLSQGQKKTYGKKAGADLTGTLRNFNLNGTSNNTKGITAPCKVLSIGHGLTTDEYTTYVNAMQLFLDEF